MRVKMLVLGTAAMSLTPGLAAAAPAAHPDSGAPQTNAPTETGQPGADCEELVASLVETGDTLVEHMVVGQRQHQFFARDANCRQRLGEKPFAHRMVRTEPRAERHAWPLDHRTFAIADHQIGRSQQLGDLRIALRRAAIGHRRNVADKRQPHLPRRRRIDDCCRRDRRKVPDIAAERRLQEPRQP